MWDKDNTNYILAVLMDYLTKKHNFNFGHAYSSHWLGRKQ